MKYLLAIFVFLLPFHALIVTSLKCRFEISEWLMNILRFWKEWAIILLVLWVVYKIFKEFWLKISNFLKDNYYFWVTLSFMILSFIYIFFPYFDPSIANFLGFKYDVFFLLAMLAWTYLVFIRDNLEFYLRILFISIWSILVIFLPFYILWDVSSLSTLFGYSKEVSTYEANSCIAFAQGVEGHYRFQGTFGWPIRFSVFLTTFFFLYLWYIINYLQSEKARAYLYLVAIWIPTLFYLPSLYFSYTKTSLLGFLFGLWIFSLLLMKKHWVKISKRVFLLIWSIFVFLAWIFVYIKRDLFLHIWSILDRLNSLEKSFEMFTYNPFWYWLWIAWPASIVEDRFWPENWFIQILLEQSIAWLALFVSVLWIILSTLYKIFLRKRDYLAIWFLTSFLTLVFMSNFTHAFEESATSYLLFMFIWAYIFKTYKLKDIKAK